MLGRDRNFFWYLVQNVLVHVRAHACVFKRAFDSFFKDVCAFTNQINSILIQCEACLARNWSICFLKGTCVCVYMRVCMCAFCVYVCVVRICLFVSKWLCPESLWLSSKCPQTAYRQMMMVRIYFHSSFFIYQWDRARTLTLSVFLSVFTVKFYLDKNFVPKDQEFVNKNLTKK